MKRPAKKTSPALSCLRIIAGDWRGRKLPILTSDGLRPTGDRLRETLFNWLAPWLPGSHCLDLFAGSGALGFEALSRGAAAVTMLELHREVANQLRANCAILGAQNIEIIETNALTWLSQPDRQNSVATPAFDLVFVDPPFAADLWQTVVDALEQQQQLADKALIYVETPEHFHLNPPDNWTLHRRKSTGAVCAHLFIRQNHADTEYGPEETGNAKAR